MKCAENLNLNIEERPFTIEEANNAKEAFLTGSASLVCPVIEINGEKIGTGKPESIVHTLRETYLALARQSAL